MASTTNALKESTKDFIDRINHEYAQLHEKFENSFWDSKMAITKNSTADQIAENKTKLDKFLGDKKNLELVRQHMQACHDEKYLKVLKIFEKTFLSYIMEDPEAEKLQEQIYKLENSLETKRREMRLGYVHPHTKQFVEGSTVVLRNEMNTNPDEEVRKACYEGLQSVGAFVVKDFCEIVKLRNRLAKMLGFVDFYDYKVTRAEGFNKEALFKILDGLERDTRDLMHKAGERLRRERGENSTQPWNVSYAISGELTKEMDPYFPFEDAVLTYARTFRGLNINYRNGTLQLDLCDRKNKYSNGFCHWPRPAYYNDREWVPAISNFTSVATPNQVGSGYTSLATLLHEGGHAAHFSNVTQFSPLFSQERQPTSVAYAETQSMFIDSLMDDAEWLGRYARDRNGNVIPWELIERNIRQKHPYKVFEVRAMLAVSYFEKALYELPEEQVTPENLLALAERIESEVQGKMWGRPIFAVPHILSDESSCYYHGYQLAELAVYQTKAHFKRVYGWVAENPLVGEDLCEVYWRPGNSESFLALVERMTGKPLQSADMVGYLCRDVEELVREERAEYELAVKAGINTAPLGNDLKVRLRLVHGDEEIADSQKEGSIEAAAQVFKKWVRKNYFNDEQRSEVVDL